MRAWLPLLALGIVALAIGGALVLLDLHHTIGLGSVGVGIILVASGLLLAFKSKGTVKTAGAEARLPSKGSGGLLKAVVALAIVVAIGVATFYGAGYLSASQPGPSTSLISSSQGFSTSSNQTLTTSVSASTISITASTLNSTQQSSTIQSSSGSQSTSTQSLSSQSKSTSSSTSLQSSTSLTTSQSSSSQSFQSTGNYPFLLASEPSVAVSGENITINAVYTNTGSAAMTVNFYMDLKYPNGTAIPGLLYYPSKSVSPNVQFQINVDIGRYAVGTYSLTFYVVDNSFDQLSDSVATSFTIS